MVDERVGGRRARVSMPERARRCDVVEVVVEEHCRDGLHADALARQLVDARVGLAHPDLARVDDDREELVDGKGRAPRVAELLDVVRQQRERHARRRAARGSRARPATALGVRGAAENWRNASASSGRPMISGARRSSPSRYSASGARPSRAGGSRRPRDIVDGSPKIEAARRASRAAPPKSSSIGSRSSSTRSEITPP